MAYYTAPGGDITAAYARRLQEGRGLTYYSPNLRRELNGLGALRFNRAVARGMYQIPFTDPAPAGTLGRLGVDADPSMLVGGIGLLALGMFLFGRKKNGSRRRRRG